MIALSDIMTNPGLLKLDLMTHGMSLDDSVLAAVGKDGYRVDGHGAFGGADDLDVVLPEETWVSVPISQGSPYTLIQADDGFAIYAEKAGCKPTPVRLSPRSQVFDLEAPSGLQFGQFGTVHGPYLALSPTTRCTFLHSASQWRFCGVADLVTPRDAIPVDDLVEAIRVAKESNPVTMVYLSVGHLGTDDGGVTFLEPYVKAIKKHFDILVAIDALPPADNSWIDHTYAMGVDAVSYNMEIFDSDRFEVICPGPARVIGRERYLEALSYATTVFSAGALTGEKERWLNAEQFYSKVVKWF